MNDEIEDRDKHLSGKGMNGRAAQSDVDGTHVVSAVKIHQAGAQVDRD